MGKPTTVEEAMKCVSDLQSKLDQSENARVWAQANAFSYICKDIKEPPTEMVLKAQIVGQRQTIEKQIKMIERLMAENKELAAQNAGFKELRRLLEKLS